MSEIVQVRCPVGPKRLFMKLRLDGQKATVNKDNLMEIACADCRKAMNDPTVTLVVHRFDFAGSLIETQIDRAASR